MEAQSPPSCFFRPSFGEAARDGRLKSRGRGRIDGCGNLYQFGSNSVFQKFFCRHPAPSAKWRCLSLSYLGPASGRRRGARQIHRRSGVMVKDCGVLARATSIGPRAATGVSADAADGIPRYGITRRGGNNDRLSTLWREVISLAGVARSFSKASSYRNFQWRHRDAMPD